MAFPRLLHLCGAAACALPVAVAAPQVQAQSLLKTEFANGGVLTSYGHINEAWLNYDDGKDQRDFAPVANANSSNRAGIFYDQALSGGTRLQARAEMQYMPRPSNKVNFDDPYVDDYALEKTDIRKFELGFQGESWGALWLGQGSMSTDGIAEIDKSGTNVTAYSSITDTAGGFFFREKDGTLSDVTVGDAYSNLDGSRRMRIRYDTPSFSGFKLSASYGQDVLQDGNDNDYYDAAISYGVATDAIELDAGIGYNWVEAPSGGSDSEFYSGSLSALHVPTGLNATLAGGSRVDQDGDFWYGKLGIIRSFFAIGDTALSVDYGYGNKFAGDDGQLTSWSVEAVQKWDRTNLEFYALYRQYDFGDDAASYYDGTAIFAGARWKF